MGNCGSRREREASSPSGLSRGNAKRVKNKEIPSDEVVQVPLSNMYGGPYSFSSDNIRCSVYDGALNIDVPPVSQAPSAPSAPSVPLVPTLSSTPQISSSRKEWAPYQKTRENGIEILYFDRKEINNLIVQAEGLTHRNFTKDSIRIEVDTYIPKYGFILLSVSNNTQNQIHKLVSISVQYNNPYYNFDLYLDNRLTLVEDPRGEYVYQVLYTQPVFINQYGLGVKVRKRIIKNHPLFRNDYDDCNMCFTFYDEGEVVRYSYVSSGGDLAKSP